MTLSKRETTELLTTGYVVVERENIKYCVFYDYEKELHIVCIAEHCPVYITEINLNEEAMFENERQ